MESRFATVPLKLEDSRISYQRLAAGFRQPFGHRHSRQEELCVVVGRSARAKLDDEVELKRWDAVRVPPRTVRQFEAGPEGAEILAFGAPNTGASLAADQNRCRTGGPIETARVRFGRLEVTNSAGGGCLSPGRW